VVSTKGRSGKSTLTAHLAVAAETLGGHRVGIVDTDPQGSATLWHRLRSADTPVLSQMRPRDVAGFMRRAEGEVDGLLIDSGPAHAEGIGQIARAADHVLIPTRPGLFDVDGIRTAVEQVMTAGSRGAIVLNACPPGRGVGEATITREARQALAAVGLPVAPAVVSQRAAFAHALIGRAGGDGIRARGEGGRGGARPLAVVGRGDAVMAKRARLTEAAARTSAFDQKDQARRAPAELVDEGEREARTEPPRRRRDGRTMRRTGRTVQLNTRITPETDDLIRDMAERDGLLIAEVIERALEAYEREQG